MYTVLCVCSGIGEGVHDAYWSRMPSNGNIEYEDGSIQSRAPETIREVNQIETTLALKSELMDYVRCRGARGRIVPNC